MRKTIVVLIGVVVIAGIVLVVGWPYVRLEFASSAYYTEQDKRAYEYYTPELLKKIPRISDDYKFEFGRITGTEANVFTMKFYGVSETRSIRNYLKSEGYELQASCDVEAECWESRATNDEVTVGNIHSQKGVFVQIYRRLYSN
ncbi:hypothetical protein [Erwinia pyrifoliae]|uniref:Lipoprotein n=1 Tax=Erwinia pyrifoliae TaxID=79967 RepID=A0ABY5X4F1_ERWPY|nr:hypothetical protein [Erwinia pyrifoliae]AUX72207.1 hypothetical protein CPI84_06785 [Erwinia pyrifoliae]MCA8877553.1 hypothetical protein [Erwinia pyrifoliae]MCT2388458.1 hypothetical protein [Erwinia pyrifoliae]MCU8586627.1 hypothetical protein [Erwinia pyrifoliae]UWS30517.1 hypothetical protein NYP81_03285 [Erwinia pyrifoliae]